MDWKWSYEFLFFVLVLHSLSQQCSSQLQSSSSPSPQTQTQSCGSIRNSSAGSTTTPSQETYQKKMYENCQSGSLGCIGVGEKDCIQDGNCLIFATYCTDDQQQPPTAPSNGTTFRTYFELTSALPSTQTADKYVALGLSADSKMGNDAIFGCITYTGSSGNIVFGYSPGYHLAFNIDAETSDKFVKETIIFENNAIYCSFSISVQFTLPSNLAFNLTNNSPFILLATGSAASEGTLSYHFPYRSYSSKRAVSVTAKGFQEVIPPEVPWVRGAITVHVVCVVFLYVSIIPTSMLVARFLRESHVEQRFQDQKIWLVIHILVQWLGVLLLLASHVTIFFIAGLYKKRVLFPFKIHYILGSTVTVLHVVQFTVGLVLAESLMYQTDGVRWLGGVLHHLNGHVIYFLSLVQIFLAPLFMATHMQHCSGASIMVIFWLVFHLIVYLTLTLMLWRSDAKAIKSMAMIDAQKKKKAGQRKLIRREIRRSVEEDSSDTGTGTGTGTGTDTDNPKRVSTQMESEPVESKDKETRKESLAASASLGKKRKKLKKPSRRSTTGSKNSKGTKSKKSRHSRIRATKNEEALSDRSSRKSKGTKEKEKGGPKKKSKMSKVSERSTSTSASVGGRPHKKKKKGKKGNNKVRPRFFGLGTPTTTTEILPPSGTGKKMSADPEDEPLEQENSKEKGAKIRGGSNESDSDFAVSARENFLKAKAAYFSIPAESSNTNLDSILSGNKQNVKSHPYRSFLSIPMKTYFSREYPCTTAVDLIILTFFVMSVLVSVSLCLLLVPANLVGECGLACSGHELTCPKGKEHHGLHKAGKKTWMKGFP